MDPRRFANQFLVLVMMAVIGVLLVYVPPQALAQVDRMFEVSPWLGYAYITVVSIGAVLFLVATIWIVAKLYWRMREKAAKRADRSRNPSELTPAEREKEIDENLAAIDELKQGGGGVELNRQLDPMVRKLADKREAQTIEIVAFGTISSGKSSLLNSLAGRDMFQTDARGGTTTRRSEINWPGRETLLLVDTPGLGEVDGAEHVHVAAQAAKNADMVLLVVDGPLRDSEFALLKTLAEMEKRILVCLNKEDWYAESSRERLIGQIVSQVADFIPAADVLSVRAQPIERTRVRVLAGGDEVTETVEEAADISELAKRMLQVVDRDGKDLLLANLLLQSRGLVEEARQKVKDALDKEAWSIVDKYTWGAGGAAALSPFPLVDLVAGFGISTKMVIDLAGIYKQKVDLEIAVNLLGQLGKNLISILGVSAITPAVTASVGSLLKTVPGAGTIAGGVLQGVVQAVITRWIGAVFIVYFRNEMQLPEGGLAQVARREWEKATSVIELRKLLSEARSHLFS